jgi:hypothetical protein
MDKLLNNQYKTFKDGALVKSKVHHMYIQLNLSKLNPFGTNNIAINK